jgi:hypothetical protein
MLTKMDNSWPKYEPYLDLARTIQFRQKIEFYLGTQSHNVIDL